MDWSFDASGIDDDDERWLVNMFSEGREAVQRTIGHSDITHWKLVCLVCSAGYTVNDFIYYVKEEGRGLAGLEVLDSNEKVTSMMIQYKDIKRLNLTIMRGLNPASKQPDFIEHATQQSVNQLNQASKSKTEKGKSNAYEKEKYVVEQEEEVAYDEGDTVQDFDEEELSNIAQLKRQKEDPNEHMEGDTDVEDMLPMVDQPRAITNEDEITGSSKPSKKKELAAARGEKRKKMARRKATLLRSQAKPGEGESSVVFEVSDEGSDDLGVEIISSDDDGFETPISIAPKYQKSRAKPLPPRVWYDEGRLLGGEQLCLKMCFVNMHQFRRALKNYHILQSRDYEYIRNDGDRVNVCCVNEHCQFYMTASTIKREKTVCIRKMVLPHTCGITYDSSRVSSTWLSKRYESTFRGDPGWKISGLIDTTIRDHGVEITPMMAYRAKNKAADIVLGNHKEQYVRIRDYLQTVIDTNPGSRCIVTTVQQPPPAVNPRFHGLFYCLSAAKEGFLNGCRPFIGVDGCFVKLTTGAQVLAASGRDGNNNLFPIAFGVVGKEDKASWCWFLEQLKYALGGDSGPFGRFTFMSDRQKGLLKAIDKVFPHCDQRFCLRHIYANFQTAGFKGADLKKIMDSAAYAYQKSDFDAAMSDLKAESESAWEWLSKIPPRHWARHAMDSVCKTDLVVNNLSEVFNKYILDTRDKPIQTMIDNIRTKLMSRFNTNREGADSSNWEITPNYAEKLELEKVRAKHIRPVAAGMGLWQVPSGERIYAVNLFAKTCGCRRWDLNGVPCKHAVACICKKKERPEDYLSDFFKKPLYQIAYNNIIFPVPSKENWTKTNSPDIDPPIFLRHPGRPKKNRRKGVHEIPQPGGRHRMTTTTCSNCRRLGHKYTTCSEPLRADLEIRKSKHKSNRKAQDRASEAQDNVGEAHVDEEQPQGPPARVIRVRGRGTKRGRAAVVEEEQQPDANDVYHSQEDTFDVPAPPARDKLPVIRGPSSAA